MSNGIIKIIDKRYKEFIDNEYLDIVQIKNICNLYKIKSGGSSSISLSDINLNTPDFKILNKKKNLPGSKSKKNQSDILKSEEFIKKYSFFIRILYACFKVDVEIFDINNNILTLKNNFQLVKAMKSKKKSIIEEHIQLLRSQQSNISENIDEDYHEYIHTYLVKIQIIEKIIGYINKLVDTNVLEKTDNLLTLILPYFYIYTEFIEEYH